MCVVGDGCEKARVAAGAPTVSRHSLAHQLSTAEGTHSQRWAQGAGAGLATSPHLLPICTLPPWICIPGFPARAQSIQNKTWLLIRSCKSIHAVTQSSLGLPEVSSVLGSASVGPGMGIGGTERRKVCVREEVLWPWSAEDWQPSQGGTSDAPDLPSPA